jgi:hypothetical protein
MKERGGVSRPDKQSSRHTDQSVLTVLYGRMNRRRWVDWEHDCIDQLIGGWFVRWKEMVVYFVWEEDDNEQPPERGEEQRRWKCDVGNVASGRGNNMVFRVTSLDIQDHATRVLEITLVLLY